MRAKLSPSRLNLLDPSTVYFAPLVSQGARLYLKQDATSHPLPLSLWTFPVSLHKGRRGFAADYPSSLPRAELSRSSVTIPRVVTTGPREVSLAGWCDRL